MNAGDLRRAAASPLGWVLLLAVAVALVSYGSVRPAPPSAAARTAYLDSVLKCPPCADISIAQSDNAIAAHLRTQVATEVREGWSNAAIERVVVAAYGPGELLKPSNPVVYVLPICVVGAALAGLALHLFGRSRRHGPLPGPSPEDEALVAGALLGRDGTP